MPWLPGGSGGYYGGTSSPFWTGGSFNPTNPITIIPGVDFNFGMLSPYGNYGNALQQGLQLDAYVRWLLSPEGNKTYFEKEVYPAIIDMLLRTEGQDAADKYKEYIDFLNAGGNPEDWNPDGSGDNGGTDDGGGDDPPTPPSEPTGATGISIEGCGFGEVSYEPTDELGTVYETVTCAPISEFCALFSNLCNGDGEIIGVTDSIACPPCNSNQTCNETTGKCEDKIDNGGVQLSCGDIGREDPSGDSGTCGECLPGYKPDNTKLSPFEGITPCVKIEDRIDENPECAEIHRETEEDGRCGNCKPGYESDGDFCVKINNTITLGTDDDDDDDGNNTEPSLSCSEQFRKVDQVVQWGGSDSPATEVCGGCIDGYTEDALGNCVQDNNNTNNVDDPDNDPCADVDCTDEANANNACCTDGGSTPFDCASVGKLPLWAGSQPTSEADCGDCLPTYKENPDGSCSPQVNGGDNGTDPGLGTGAGAGTGSITEGMFKKYLPEFQPINSELLGRAPSYSRGMNMEGLFKGFF